MVYKCLHQLAAPFLVSMISPVTAVSTCRHLRSADQGDLVVPRTRTAGFGPWSFSVAGPLAWNILRPVRRHHWHSDSSLAGWKLKCFFAVTTRQRSHHNFYYQTAWNKFCNEVNWTDPRRQPPTACPAWTSTRSSIFVVPPTCLSSIATVTSLWPRPRRGTVCIILRFCVYRCQCSELQTMSQNCTRTFDVVNGCGRVCHFVFLYSSRLILSSFRLFLYVVCPRNLLTLWHHDYFCSMTTTMTMTIYSSNLSTLCH